MVITDDGRRSVIAVVDDDRRVLESLASLLDSADYDVRVFASGSALLESGGLADVACLISDVAMPLMDGFELARAVEAVRPGVPVVFITGRPDLLLQAPLEWRGRHRVFKKPFDGQELLTAVALLLKGPPG